MTPALVLGVDLDGVCARYEHALRDSVARQLGRDPSTLAPQQTLSSFEEWGLDAASWAEAHRHAVLEDRIFRHMEAMPGVSEELWALSDAGVWIRIITHRLCVNWAHEVTAADTAVWLDEHRIPYRDLCFIGDKATVGADVYVDDDPRQVARLRASDRRVLVFDQPYNRSLPGPRAHDWSEVRRHVEEALADAGAH